MSSENRELKKAGLKVTAPRLKILSMLSDASEQGEHFSAEDLYQRLRDMGEDIGLATVYRVLTQFESAGLVKRHNFNDNPERTGKAGYSVFEMASDGHHDHMVDIDSSEVIEFIDEEIERRQHLIAEARGYEIVDHSLVLYVRKKRDA
ncbi:MAG: ferric iron uptake transcriptional regulator [Halieaceae bacterium]|jgi:Fur family ferric uptake transcriptional regulator